MAGLRSAALFHVLLFLFAGCCGVRGAVSVAKKPVTNNILVTRKETSVKIVTSPQTLKTTMDPCQTMKCRLNEVCLSLNNQTPQCVSSKNLNYRTETPVTKGNVNKCKTCPMSSSSPVCGSDGLNYASQCKLEQQACLTGTTLTVKCSGPCPCASKPAKKPSVQTSSTSSSRSGSKSGSKSGSNSGSDSGSNSGSKSDESSSSSVESGSGAGWVDSEENSKESQENTKESESSEEDSSKQDK